MDTNTKNELPKYKVELTHPLWNTVLRVINQSNAPHLLVQEVQKELVDQLNQQLEAQKAAEQQTENPDDLKK